jgi:hypothetical protein
MFSPQCSWVYVIFSNATVFSAISSTFFSVKPFFSNLLPRSFSAVSFLLKRDSREVAFHALRLTKANFGMLLKYGRLLNRLT